MCYFDLKTYSSLFLKTGIEKAHVCRSRNRFVSGRPECMDHCPKVHQAE